MMATVTVSKLPSRAGDAATRNTVAAAEAALEAPTTSFAPIAVLIVDDDRLASSSLKWMLGMDARVGTLAIADSPDAAIAKLRSVPEPSLPGVILLDVNFAGQERTGIDYLGEFHAASPRSRLVVMSAGREFATVESALANGADGFIWKNESSADFIEATIAGITEPEFVTSKSVVRDPAGPK